MQKKYWADIGCEQSSTEQCSQERTEPIEVLALCQPLHKLDTLMELGLLGDEHLRPISKAFCDSDTYMGSL